MIALLFCAAGAAACAAGSGYSQLGGIAAYSAALKELVLLSLLFCAAGAAACAMVRGVEAHEVLPIVTHAAFLCCRCCCLCCGQWIQPTWGHCCPQRCTEGAGAAAVAAARALCKVSAEGFARATHAALVILCIVSHSVWHIA
jgi:hypothetical protein